MRWLDPSVTHFINHFVTVYVFNISYFVIVFLLYRATSHQAKDNINIGVIVQ